ncbi:hypothetical protein CEXT_75871 [Caerostris extrusa]|uniref:Uncharacterized protein n=1 Tax=Caerostris extrusa TaxID=172846 RepID=A0AAV4WXP4_CAEEX|nr:hypothetical protein CEXT_75871 [Caerostris extrusa]
MDKGPWREKAAEAMTSAWKDESISDLLGMELLILKCGCVSSLFHGHLPSTLSPSSFLGNKTRILIPIPNSDLLPDVYSEESGNRARKEAILGLYFMRLDVRGCHR